MTAHPSRWVPSAYFSQALPYAMVITVSAVFYKNLQLSNDWIAFLTSWFFLPWLLKPVWAPLLEKTRSPGQALIFCQVACAVLCVVMMAVLLSHTDAVIPLTLIVFGVMAFLSASFDMLSDAVYIKALSTREQQRYIGVRTFFYQVARVFCIGGVVMLVGVFAKTHSYHAAWALGFVVLAMVFVVLALWHGAQLPDVHQSARQQAPLLAGTLAFFKQPGIVMGVLFLLLYNFGEAQVQRVLPLFLMSGHHGGGLAYNNHQVGVVFGLCGTIALSLGALASGWCVVRWGVKRCLWWMTVVMVTANLGYILLASDPMRWAYYAPVIIVVAQASFGLANSAYMCVLLRLSTDRRYALTWYALASGFMALGMMLPGMFSGILLAHFSFIVTFCFIWLASLVSFIMLGVVRVI